METIDGFTCISDHIREFYPEQEGLYYGTIIPGYLGGSDPLDGVEIWESDKGCPHWLYVTYGFSDLYADDEEEDIDGSDDVDGSSRVSGFGFELTFRLKRGREDTPPGWPINMLQNLARYVFSSGNTFDSGHYLNANGPIALETDTQLTCIGFLTDPELGRIDTVNGSMIFLEAIGITKDEQDAMMCWNGKSFLTELTKHIPYGIADLSRTSLMTQPDFRRAWEQGVERDGSSTGVLYLSDLAVSLENNRGYLRLGAGHIDQILTLLKARIGKERTFALQGNDAAACFECAEQPDIDLDDTALILSLTPDNLNELCQLLKPHAGSCFMQTMPLTIEIVPTHIRDNNGDIVQTIE